MTNSASWKPSPNVNQPPHGFMQGSGAARPSKLVRAEPQARQPRKGHRGLSPSAANLENKVETVKQDQPPAAISKAQPQPHTTLNRAVRKQEQKTTGKAIADVKHAAQASVRHTGTRAAKQAAQEVKLVIGLFNQIREKALGDLEAFDKLDKFESEGELKLQKKDPLVKALGLEHTYKIIKTGNTPEGDPIVRIEKNMGVIGEGAIKKVKKWQALDTGKEEARGKFKQVDKHTKASIDKMIPVLKLAKEKNIPNIEFGDLKKINDAYILVTNYRSGGDLFNAIVDNNLFENNELLQLDFAVQMLTALVALQKAGIAHRDLKPENIFVEEGKIYIADPDLAICKNDPTTGIGTIAYWAPENYTGDVTTLAKCQKADDFAVGLILYAMKYKSLPQNEGILPEQDDKVGWANLDMGKMIEKWEAANGPLTPHGHLILSLLNPNPQARSANIALQQALALFDNARKSQTQSS